MALGRWIRPQQGRSSGHRHRWAGADTAHAAGPRSPAAARHPYGAHGQAPLDPKAAAELGLDPSDGTEREWYFRLWRAARRVLRPIDPHPETPRHKRLSKEAFTAIRDARDPKFVAAREARFHEFSNALIWASVEAMPAELRERWDGTVAMDATPVLASRIGTTGRSSRVSSEPDAGWYVRDHTALGDDGGGDKMRWAWDATLVTMASPCEDDSFPKLLLGMSMDRPGFRPAENAMRAMGNLLASDLPRGYAVGDRVYFPMAKPESLQVPLRKAGYALVGSQVKRQTGVQGEFAGATLVDGNWYCPAMPKPLQEATPRLEAGEIDAETHARLIERRRQYLMRPKEAPRANGSQKFACPAEGAGATVDCPFKGQCAKTRGKLTKVMPRDLPTNRPKVCSRTTITIPLEAGAKYAQPLQWGTAEWHAAYTYPCQTIESKNASLKAGNGEMLGDRTRRMMRGMAAHNLAVAVLVTVHNIRTIERHLAIPRPENTTPRPLRRERRKVYNNIAELLHEAQAPPAAA